MDPAGGGDALTEDAASAPLADGDTLSFAAGVHTSSIQIDGRSLVFQGADARTTTCDGQGCTEQVVAPVSGSGTRARTSRGCGCDAVAGSGWWGFAVLLAAGRRRSFSAA